MDEEQKWVNYIKYLKHPMPCGFYAYTKDAALWADAELSRLRAFVSRVEDVEGMAHVIIDACDAAHLPIPVNRIAHAILAYAKGEER